MPADARSRLGLSHGDAVLAHARLAGGWAVASRRALHLVADDETTPDAATPWCDVNRGSFDPATHTLTVWWVSGAHRALVLPDDAPARQFARTFRDCVQQSVVYAVPVMTPGGQAQVALRRAADGTLFTQTLGDVGIDFADPDVASALAKAETGLRDAAGLPV